MPAVPADYKLQIRHSELSFEADVKALKTQLMKTKLRGISLEMSCLVSDPGYIYWGKKR